MPQTDEHLSVLELLGVAQPAWWRSRRPIWWTSEWARVHGRRGARRACAARPYAGRFRGAAFRARTGAGLDELRAALGAAATCGLSADEARRPGPAPAGGPRVLRAADSGTVVTGTLWSGTGGGGRRRWKVLPAGSACARVRGVQEPRTFPSTWRRPATAWPLNLASGEHGRRGAAGRCSWPRPAPCVPTDRFDAWVRLSGSGLLAGRAVGNRHAGARGARHAPKWRGRVLFMDGLAAVQPRERRATRRYAWTIRLPLSGGDRFVVRSMTPVHVVGGGQVLHAHPRRRTNLREGERGLWTPCGRATSRPRAMRRFP